MNEFKSYIIRIIIVAAVVQFGTLVSGEKYKKTYSFFGAIYIIFVLLSFPEFSIDKLSYKYDSNIKSEIGESVITRQFTDNVAKKISESIMLVFNLRADVTVSTDSTYSKICIVIDCNCSDEEKYRIEEYVRKTFCTPEDEVTLIE